MRESRPVAPAERAAAAARSRAADAPDGGLSAMLVLASAAWVGGPRVASGSWRTTPGKPAQDGRGDPSGLSAARSLDHPTVTGAGLGLAGSHVGGGMLPPVSDIVALSDGTRISFRVVDEIPEFEYA